MFPLGVVAAPSTFDLTMSIEVLLIPIGIAALAAVAEARSTDLCEKCRATRITSRDVLLEVLEQVDATISSSTETRITGSSQWGPLTLQKVGDFWLGRVDNASDETTQQMITVVDQTVGRVMQARTARDVIARANALGFRLIEQSQEDGSLNYVFEEA